MSNAFKVSNANVIILFHKMIQSLKRLINLNYDKIDP